MDMSKPVCVVIGVGPGNGTAIARKFADQGYAVALCARTQAKLDVLAEQLPDAAAFAYDVTDVKAAERVLADIEQSMGVVSVVVYNAGSGTWGNVDEVSVDNFQSSWEVNTRGLLLAVKAVLPQMRQGGGGAIVVTGATASLRGGLASTAFASAKAAQRSLAQSLARQLGPEKIHVAYVVLDGMVDLERTMAKMTDKPLDFFLSAEQVAEAFFYLATQPERAWTFEIDLRPYGEKW
jgi:NADP-dependent 3-hydroxy acid dehydrogenase YdfG